MAAEGIQDQLSLGAELPVTLAALLFRPGHLTREYLAGRIVRYVPPLRLYLVASLAFFFILSWTADFGGVLDEARGEVAAEADSVNAAAALIVTRPDGRLIGIQLDTTGPGVLTPTKRGIQRRIERLNGMDKEVLYREFLAGFQRNAPRAVFLLLPIYALVLKLLYFRRTRLYAEHFIFALHVHAFAFALFTLTFILPEWLDSLVLLVWMPVYIFLAMRRVYEQSIPKTLLKYAILFFAYTNLLLLLLIATAVITALTI